MDIHRAVEVLASGRDPQFKLERELAVLAFSGWLNWPKEPYAGTNLALIGVCHGLTSEQDRSDAADPQWLTQALEPRLYLEQLQNGAVITPDFPLVSGEYGYDETRYAADIVRFMLSYNPSRMKDRRKSASLGKACEFLNKKRGFPDLIPPGTKRWRSSDSWHQEVWKAYKRSSPFQFVRYYGPNTRWLFDPTSPRLLEDVRALSEQRDEVKAFFSHVAWVQARLMERIDRRSMTRDDFFPCPTRSYPSRARSPRLLPAFIER